jgi:hypothetical protein
MCKEGKYFHLSSDKKKILTHGYLKSKTLSLVTFVFRGLF